MHAEKKLTKKQGMLIIGGFSICCIAGIAGWFFLSQQKDIPAPPRPAAANIAKKGAVANEMRRQETQPAKKAETPQPAPSPGVKSDATLGDLTRLRGIKQVLQQEAEIADLRKRLREAQQAVIVTPVPQPTIKLPDEEEKPKKRRSGPSVVSVQGVDGNLSADIRTSEGVVTLKNGARFNGGVLVVSRKNVAVRKNGDLARIPFE